VVTADELRDVMRRQPAGVSVVTVDTAGGRLGLTVGTLVSLSLAPPLVGVAVAKQAALHELLREAGCFAVSLLAAEQDALARHFARGVPPIALWQGVAVREGTRAPLLEGAVGWLECAVAAEHEAGDHTFFVGAVERAETGAAAPALVRMAGDYLPA
jgi:flavin reductase (DIM6/NTAB) family NADH-FMN oxidoreductase RutF